MITIIIADNFKKGMKSRGCAGLLPYNRKSNLFQQQYDSIKSVFPKSDILYVYGFDAKKFDAFMEDKSDHYAPYTIKNNKYANYNHGYSLYLAKDAISQASECLILLGYEPISSKTIRMAKRTKQSSVLLDDSGDSKLGCILDQNSGSVSHIFFDLDNHISDIYLLKKPEIRILTSLLENSNIYNMFLFEIMNNIISQNGKLEALSLAK